MSTKTFPVAAQFLLCEDVRLEQGNKVTLLGVHGGDNVILKQKLPKNKKIALDRLCVYARFFGGGGEFAIRGELVSPSGTTRKQDLDDAAKIGESRVHSVIVQFVPFEVDGLGDYKLKIFFDDRLYEYSFELRGEYES